MSRHRAFCFTLNNYSIANEQAIQSLEFRYLCYGRETAPTTGTPHLQGYVYFEDGKTMRTVIKMFPQGTHLEPARGSPAQAIEYCQKEDKNAFVSGTPPTSQKEKGTGEQDRWQGYLQAVAEGNLSALPPRILANNLRGLQYANQALMNSKRDLSDVEIDNIWLWGPAGTGKTTRVMDAHIPEQLYIKDTVDPRWDGYADEPYVLIDDYDRKSFGVDHLKRWCGNQRFSVQMRYARAIIRPQRFYITSNYHPSELFEARDLEAIMRRFTVIDSSVAEVDEPGPDWTEDIDAL